MGKNRKYTKNIPSQEMPEAELQDLSSVSPIAKKSISDLFRKSTVITRNWLSMQDNQVNPIVILNSDLVIAWRNKAFKTFRETPGLKYIGRPFHELFTTFAQENHLKTYINSLRNKKGGFSWKGRVQGVRLGSRYFEADIIVFPLEYNEQELPQWFLAVIFDTTELAKEAVQRTFNTILQASLLKDEDTGNHVKRVNAYSRAIAKKLLGKRKWFIEVNDDYVENIGILAAFHDVGKIGTPDHILLKRGKLTPEEWETMKEHAINGAILLKAHPNIMAQDIAKSHHEKWDGSGYPFGLVEEDIPLSARIVAIADVYDALRSERPYKKPFKKEKTEEIIISDAGTHFDPDLVEIFKNTRKEFDEIYKELQDASIMDFI